jgi:hypothetical protein
MVTRDLPERQTVGYFGEKGWYDSRNISGLAWTGSTDGFSTNGTVIIYW